MHEVALVSAAVTQAIDAARRAGAVRVERLTFALSPGSHVTPDAVETLVAIVGRGTLVEGASLAFERVEMPSELALVSIDVETPAGVREGAPTVD